jgi:hypothetical protein
VIELGLHIYLVTRTEYARSETSVKLYPSVPDPIMILIVKQRTLSREFKSLVVITLLLRFIAESLFSIA